MGTRRVFWPLPLPIRSCMHWLSMSGIVRCAASLSRSPAAYWTSRNVRCLSDLTHDSSRFTSSPLSTAGSFFGRLPNGMMATGHGIGQVKRKKKRSPQTDRLKVLQPTLRCSMRWSWNDRTSAGVASRGERPRNPANRPRWYVSVSMVRGEKLRSFMSSAMRRVCSVGRCCQGVISAVPVGSEVDCDLQRSAGR